MEDRVLYADGVKLESRNVFANDVDWIVNNCSPACIADIRKTNKDGVTAAEVISECVKESADVITVTLNNEPIFIFGVVAKNDWYGGCGYIWLIPTPLIEKAGVLVWRRAKKHIKELFNRYTELVTHVDITNETFIKFIEVLGFKRDSIVAHEHGNPYALYKLKEVK